MSLLMSLRIFESPVKTILSFRRKKKKKKYLQRYNFKLKKNRIFSTPLALLEVLRKDNNEYFKFLYSDSLQSSKNTK